MTGNEWADFRERLKAYDPDHDRGRPLRFAEVAAAFPEPSLNVLREHPRVRMADFAEIGFCAYKGWHRGRGTEVRRPVAVQAKATVGERIHVRKVVEELRAARKLPAATPASLRNPKIDIARIPELPAWVKVGHLIYASRIERAGRTAGDLQVTEIKTGNWVWMPDHILQVWGYCLSAPGALLRETEGNFRANAIRWGLSYPRKEFGPYPFTEDALELVRRGMRLFERLFQAGANGDIEVPVDPDGPSVRKCPKCAFSHACRWSRAPPIGPPLTLGGLSVSSNNQTSTRTSEGDRTKLSGRFARYGGG